MTLFDKRFERHQQVEIDRAEIHTVNDAYYHNPSNELRRQT